jgi:hypothetical protein
MLALESLGAQFCAELAFGVLFSLGFVPKAPVGALFYRLLGTAALVLSCAATALRWRAVEARGDPALVALVAAVIAYPVYSGPFRGRAWALGLAAALVANGAAVVVLVADAMGDAGAVPLALGSVSALATGTVSGSIGVAMVLGHWYLTIPNLGIEHLVRLNRVCVGSLLTSLAAIAAVYAVCSPALGEREPPLAGPWGWFHIGTRIAVGVLVPLLFAWMASSSLRYRNTRSATGILYASTVLALIGAAAAVALQDAYGVPL